MREMTQAGDATGSEGPGKSALDGSQGGKTGAAHPHPARKPAGIIYGVDDRPPLPLLIAASFQQVGLVAIALAVPLALFRAAHADTPTTLSALSLSLLAMAIGAAIQAIPRIGSGYLAPSATSSLYFGPAHDAIAAGGLHLMFGMMMFAGGVEAALSRGLRRLRPIFPPEIAGLVIFLMGMGTGSIAVRKLLAVDSPGGFTSTHALVAGLTLATMVGLNVWTRGFLRLSCSLLGMGVGYAAAIATGLLGTADLARLEGGPILAFPQLGHLGLSFDIDLVIPFMIGAVAATMKATAVMSMCQSSNDADWVRTDLRSAARGVLADGAATAVSGLLGTTGANVAPSCVGVAAATGITSRRVAFGLAAILAALAFIPDATTIVLLMPEPVLGAVFLFSACFIVLSGVDMATSRMLDQRRTIVLGAAIVASTAGDLYPQVISQAPAWAHPLLSSSLVLGTTIALVLNLLFRLGVRRRAVLTVDPAAPDLEQVHDFMENQGARWGARRDVVRRAQQAASQLVEAVLRTCEPHGKVELAASFDEFNLDLRASWRGARLSLPTRPPTAEEIVESLDGERNLAGYLLRSLADRSRSEAQGDHCSLAFHFEH
jgi:NCS2 family nucleobase:cation symporter-2